MDNGNSVAKQILINDCNKLMQDLKALFPKAHYNHFGHFPRFFYNFLDTGSMDFSLLKGDRKEKTFEEFKKKDGDE